MSAPQSETQILDRGYRRYDGERLGQRAAMRSVAVYTAQRVLGIHRKSRFKILPVIVILMTFLPAIVFVGIVVLTKRFEENSVDGAGDFILDALASDYPALFSFIIAAILLFAAFVAPEVLCTDRRTGMLGLYFASALNRWTYLASKFGTVIMLMLIVTLGPSLLLLIGYSTQGYGPDGFVDFMRTLGRVFAAGLGVGMFHATIALAISSTTSRKAAASATFIMLTMGTGVVIPILQYQADMSPELGAFNVLALPQDLAYRIFGQTPPVGFDDPLPMSTPIVYLAVAGWMLVSGLIIWDRYRRIEVAR